MAATAYGEQFERAVAAAMTGATVVTGNTRSTRAVKQAAERELLRRQQTAWTTPDVLPLSALVGRLYGAAIVGSQAPLPLSGEQELQLWRQIVAHSSSGRELLMSDAAAELSRRSLRLAAEYRVRLNSSAMSATSETRAFSGWTTEFQDQLAHHGWTSESFLVRDVVPLLPRLELPEHLFAFLMETTPAQEELLRALQDAGVNVERMEWTFTDAPETGAGLSDVRLARVEFAGEADELTGAAQWARSQVERNPSARVGVVFFDLARRRAQVASAFRQVLDPECLLGEASAAPFEVAAPLPLRDYAPVRCALRWLALPVHSLAFHEFAAALTSPYINAGPLEAARFVRQVQPESRREVSLNELQSWLRRNATSVPNLRAALDPLPAHAEFASVQAAATWTEFARAFLRALGWPGTQALSSDEYQCTARWGELLTSMSSLAVTGWRGKYSEFVQRLESMAAAQNFLPETLGAPVQIMDASEAAGSVFDALWIGAASDELWPEPEKPSPLIPLSLLQESGFPLPGSAAGESRMARATARLLQSAPEVVLSLARRTADEREQRWSPAFQTLPEPTVPQDAPPPLPLRFAAVPLEELSDAQAPALDAAREAAGGGTWLLADQSNCPFRAFAIRRLHAEQERGPNEELAATDRGKVVEKALEILWSELQTSAALARPDLAALVERAVDAALRLLPARSDEWTRRFRQLERARTIEVIAEWLEQEKLRPPFRVLAHQLELRIALGGMELHGFIDRIDEANGRALVLDYKTGADTSPSAWKVPRPRLPQLPLYAVARQRAHGDAAGAAFAVVRRGEAAFRSFLADGGLLPGGSSRSFVREDWSLYLARWEEELERIASDFVRGAAAVDPKSPPGFTHSPCEKCHLGALCRVRSGADDDGEDGGSDE